MKKTYKEKCQLSDPLDYLVVLKKAIDDFDELRKRVKYSSLEAMNEANRKEMIHITSLACDIKDLLENKECCYKENSISSLSRLLEIKTPTFQKKVDSKTEPDEVIKMISELQKNNINICLDAINKSNFILQGKNIWTVEEKTYVADTLSNILPITSKVIQIACINPLLNLLKI